MKHKLKKKILYIFSPLSSSLSFFHLEIYCVEHKTQKPPARLACTYSEVPFSFLIHRFICFLGFRGLYVFLMPGLLSSLVLGLFEEPLEAVPEEAVNVESLCCCSMGFLVDVVGSVVDSGRNIPGSRTSFLLYSMRPPFSCCNFNTASNFCLLTFSASDWRSSALPFTSVC